jgi:uncharacterized membrane protein YraQ (UPF0718 family)
MPMELLKDAIFNLLQTLRHNAPILAFGVAVAAAIAVYGNPEKIRGALSNRMTASVFTTVAFGVFTPFCACGTMAVVVAMLSTAIPWSAIMAFLTSSPLMSPDEFIFIAGIISPGFAAGLTAASIAIGLGSGIVAHIVEKKTHFLDGQIRMAPPAACPAEAQETAKPDKYKIRAFLRYVYQVGVRQILLYFSIFVIVGYLINRYVPSEWITVALGEDNPFAIPLMALVGIPLYITGPSSIPLIQSLLDGGASTGALMAFMITGPGTSAGVIAGIGTIMKGRAVALYLGLMLAGALAAGYLTEFFLWALRSI